MERLSVLVLVAAIALAGCSYSEPVTTTALGATTPPTSTSTTTQAVTTTKVEPSDELAIPEALTGVAVDTVSLDGAKLRVAIADTSELRQQGLMNVPDLLDLDGMLFVFDGDSAGGFWMKDTLIPLDIAFFDATGQFVDGFEMEPCTTDDCPTYRPSGSYRYALEMSAGTMPEVIAALGLDESQ